MFSNSAILNLNILENLPVLTSILIELISDKAENTLRELE